MDGNQQATDIYSSGEISQTVPLTLCFLACFNRQRKKT